MGLLITFLKLYEYVKDDLNTLSKKHLDFYYKDILSQTPNGVVAKNMYINIHIDENIDFLTVDQGKLIVASRNPDGSEITYETEEEIILNNTVISDLRTLFLSRNKSFDYNSRNKLVSGIYSKTHCANATEVNEFNNNEQVFSTLGEDQVLITDREKEQWTMLVLVLQFPLLLLCLVKAIEKSTLIFHLLQSQLNSCRI